MTQKAVILEQDDLILLLDVISEKLSAIETPETELEVWLKAKLESAHSKLNSVFLRKTPDEFVPFRKEYGGFESILDLISGEDVSWWMGEEANLCPEFTGTLTVNIDYDEE